MLLLCGLTLILSLAGKPVFDYAWLAADQLADPRTYINAVLKGGAP